MRAVVEVEEDRKGRTCLVVTELPYQVNPDNLAPKIAELARDGRVTGIADVRDETSDRTGQRLVIVLKRDAVAKVVLNNLYKHTQLQDTFGANMLALVDGVPRTLRLDQMIRHWVTHQIEVIVRRTRYLLRKAQERAHILRALLKAIDRIDEVIALIRASDVGQRRAAGPDGPAGDRRDPGPRDPRHAAAPAGRPRAAALIDEYEELMAQIADYEAILASPERQRQIVGDRARRDRREVRRRPAHRRSSPTTATCPCEDLIAEEDVVVTITRGGYAKRTKTDLYRAQRRGGKGVPRRRSCAPTTSSSTSSSPARTTGSCSSRTRAGCTGRRPTSCPRRPADAARSARGQPAGLPARRAHRRGPGAAATTRSRRTWCWPPRPGWSRSRG